MRDTLINCTVIPALPGYRTVYDFDTEMALDAPVIAWRVETTQILGPHEELMSAAYAITVDGDVASNCVGIQQPDGSVSLFLGGTYASLAEANAAKYPK